MRKKSFCCGDGRSRRESCVRQLLGRSHADDLLLTAQCFEASERVDDTCGVLVLLTKVESAVFSNYVCLRMNTSAFCFLPWLDIQSSVFVTAAATAAASTTNQSQSSTPQTVELSATQRLLKDAGVKCSKKDLAAYLDARGITFIDRATKRRGGGRGGGGCGGGGADDGGRVPQKQKRRRAGEPPAAGARSQGAP